MQMSAISFSITVIFFVLVFWLVFVHKFRNLRISAWGTFGLLGALFLLPVAVKLMLTHGFSLTIPDQSLIKAYIMKYIHINHFVDPLMINLPPYYPPLFFFVSGKLSQVLGMTGNILFSYSLGSLLFFGLILGLMINLFYRISRSLARHTGLIFVAFLVFYYVLFFDFDYIFGKGYEHLSFVLMLHILLEIDQKKHKFSVPKVGILMGIIIMLYFYPFLLFLPSFLLLVVFQKAGRWQMAKKFIAATGISVAVSSPYLVPLVIKIAGDVFGGGKSYVFISISSNAFFPFLPNFLSIPGFIMGIASLGFFLFNRERFRLTKMFLVSIYSFFLLNLLAMAIFKKILLVMTPFWTMTKYVFVLASIVFLKQIMVWGLRRFDSVNARKTIHLVLLVFVVMTFQNLLNSNFYRITETGKEVFKDRKNRVSMKIHRCFQKDFPHVISNHYELAADVPVFFFVPFHLTYAHPYSDIDGRLKYLDKLTRLRDLPLQEALRNCPYGPIDGIVGKERDGIIQVEVSRPWEIVTMPSYFFEFHLSHFGPDFFAIRKIDHFTVIKAKQYGCPPVGQSAGVDKKGEAD